MVEDRETDRGMLTVKQVALKLNCSQRTVRRMIDRGELEANPVGRLIRIRPEVVDAKMGIAPARH